MDNPFSTHLCGPYHIEDKRCPHLLYADKADMKHGNKLLKQFYVYCTANGRCRSLGCVATFTGNSPTWCPRRKESLPMNEKKPEI